MRYISLKEYAPPFGCMKCSEISVKKISHSGLLAMVLCGKSLLLQCHKIRIKRAKKKKEA